jgi:L-lactate dehydrogenase complex protein LldG
MDAESRISLFADRLHDYDAAVFRCAPGEIAQAVAQALNQRGKTRLLVPEGFPKSWLPRKPFEFVTEQSFRYDELDRCEGVITGCAVAIAMSGTIILKHSNANGRRALSLIPDYHLCVIDSGQIVETVPEGLRALGSATTMPITTISGPSATADIEMTRIKGVHGPRTLDVILAILP